MGLMPKITPPEGRIYALQLEARPVDVRPVRQPLIEYFSQPGSETKWPASSDGMPLGLSRSALADRFIRLIGVPPMHYLANWRMQVATQKLRNTSASLAQVAEIVGYDSEAAFSRAFKKAFGAAPATWRRSNS